MYCFKCGKKIDEDSKFCEHCGTKVGKTGVIDSIKDSIPDDIKEKAKKGVKDGVKKTKEVTNKLKDNIPDNVKDNFKNAETKFSSKLPPSLQKHKKVMYSGIVVALLLVCFFFFKLVTGGSIVDTKNIKLAKQSTNELLYEGYTLEQILNKGLRHVKWKEEKDGEEVYVIVTGTKKETGDKVKISYKVASDGIWFEEYYVNDKFSGASNYTSFVKNIADE